jgi:NDP-sugar pyrophosphorylase family protein
MTRSQFNPIGIDAVILCGGLGTRLKETVPNKQKCVAEIAGKPFLDILIDTVIRHNFRRIILAAGHLAEQVIEYAKNRQDCEIEISLEDKPLGTGGALKNAKKFIYSDNFLVMNGDTFCPAHLTNFYNFHFDNNALCSLVVAKMDDVSSYSSLEIDDGGRILKYRFNERDLVGGKGFVSAGIYLMRKDIFEYFPDDEHFSLEYDVFPKLVGKDCYGYMIDEKFFDIGTAERYLEAQRILSELI